MISLILDSAEFDIDRKNLWDKTSSGMGEDLTETDLHYIAFMSRITFRVDDVVVIGPRRETPLFDFLTCIATVLRDLENGLPASISFTEAADRVHLKRLDGRVFISASEEEVSVWTDYGELVETLASFLADTRTTLFDRVPGLCQNPYVTKIYT